MSRKHSPLSRLAPLAAAAALTCTCAAVHAQQTVSQSQTLPAPVSATASLIPGANGVVTNTFANTSTTINDNSYDAQGIGNTSNAALAITNQALATPTVTVNQTVSAGSSVSGTTNAKIGIDTTGTAAGNGGARTGAQGTVNDNSALSSAEANTNAATLTIQSGAPLTVGSAVSASTSQGAMANVQANTSLPDLLGINLLPRSGNWDNVGLTVNSNQVGATAAANQSQTAVAIEAGGSLALGAPVSSTVSQQQQANVTATSLVGQFGIGIQNTLVTSGVLPANGSFTVNGNAMTADAVGNQQENSALVEAASMTQTGGTPNNIRVTSTQSGNGGVNAGTQAGFMGVNNQKPASSGNQYTVSGNALQASASGNIGTNTSQARSESNATGVGVAVGSTQTFSNAAGVNASANAVQVGVAVGGLVLGLSSNEHQVINGNAVTAGALGSQVGNRALLSGTTVNLSGASLTSSQIHASGNVAASAGVSTLGASALTSTTNNHQTINDNTVQADAQGTLASNQSVVNASNAATGVGAYNASTQQHLGGNVTANAAVSNVLGRSSPISNGDQVTVNANAVNATAQGASSESLSSVQGATVANSSATMIGSQTHAGGNVNATASVSMLGTTSSATSATGNLTVNDNAVQTSAQGAFASNRASVKADSAMTDATASAANTQMHISGDINALTFVGRLGSQTPLSTNDQLVVTGNKLTSSANSQSANNQAILDASSINASSIGRGASVDNDQSHSGGNVMSYVGNSQSFSPNPVNAVPTMVGASGSAIGGTAQVSGNSAAADASINLATNATTIQSGGSIGGIANVSLINDQSVVTGNATALVKVNYGITGARSLGNVAVVSGNTALASASQNQAANTLTVKAGNSLGNAAPALDNTQSSLGSTFATAETSLLTGTGIANFNNGDTTITNNTVSTSARANVANNALIIEAGTQAGNVNGSLDNSQRSFNTATATTNLQVPVGSLLTNQALGGAITVSGNAADALAMGNASLNTIQANAGTALNGGSQFALTNTQDNFGAINATTAFNAPVVSSGGSVNLMNNTATATAFGNSAVNQMTVAALPGQSGASASLTSNQLNTGAVTAVVNGNYTNTSGGGSTGSINISGNRGIAVAVGNSSVSSMSIGTR